jgi:predicted DNA-binding protein YlxM (UPF0122 family)
MMNEQEVEWVSVSELAKRLHKTKQTVYNLIKKGVYETKEFQRGSMRGFLICIPKQEENE